MNIRRSIWIYIKKIFRIKNGEIVPKWLIWIPYILFPIYAIRVLPGSNFKWEPWDDIFTIYGTRYTSAFFRFMGKHGAPIGSTFKIIDKGYNTISIEILEEEKNEEI